MASKVEGGNLRAFNSDNKSEDKISSKKLQ